MSRRIWRSYCWGVLSGPRLRQVALVARDCGQVAGELRRVFGWPPPFHDPGVGQFGLTNAAAAARRWAAVLGIPAPGPRPIPPPRPRPAATPPTPPPQ